MERKLADILLYAIVIYIVAGIAIRLWVRHLQRKLEHLKLIEENERLRTELLNSQADRNNIRMYIKLYETDRAKKHQFLIYTN